MNELRDAVSTVRQAFSTSRCRGLLLNFRDTPFASSTLIASALYGIRQWRTAGLPVRVMGLSDTMLKLFRDMSLLSDVTVIDTTNQGEHL
jgi:anti-anti-sigma regulatory factor